MEKYTNNITRRAFSVGAAGLTALAYVPMTALASEAQAPQAPAADAAQDGYVAEYSCDVVVAGSGGCGTAAACRCAQLGLKTIVVEQSGFTGGTSRCTEGLFAVETHLQEEDGIDLTADECFSLSMDFNHWEADASLNKDLFSTSAANFDWLEGLGIGFKYAIPNGHSLPTWHVYETDGSGVPGALYMDTFMQAAVDAGAEVLLSTSAQELVMEDGTVAGLVCSTEEGPVRVNAPVVILATGGYSNNAEMMRTYAGIDPERVIVAGLGQRNGEGIAMGLAAGGQMCSHPGTAMYYGGQPEGAAFGTALWAAFAASPILWINEKGERFTTEEFAATNFSYAGNALKGQRDVFAVINEAIVEHMTTEGVYNDMGEYYKLGDALPTLRDEIEQQMADNPENIWRAETPEDIAAVIGADPATVAAMLEEYNGFCAAGKDEAFGKPTDWLAPVEGGPYYVYRLKIGMFTTCGGLKVNTDCAVVDQEGNPISGLYAGGCDAGGLYGATYDVSICTGNAQGWAVHSGKRAAESAAAYLGTTAE